MRPDKADEGVVESVHRNKPARALSYNDWPLIHPLQCVSVTVLDAAYVGKGGMQHIHTYIHIQMWSSAGTPYEHRDRIRLGLTCDWLESRYNLHAPRYLCTDGLGLGSH